MRLERSWLYGLTDVITHLLPSTESQYFRTGNHYGFIQNYASLLVMTVTHSFPSKEVTFNSPFLLHMVVGFSIFLFDFILSMITAKTK